MEPDVAWNEGLAYYERLRARGRVAVDLHRLDLALMRGATAGLLRAGARGHGESYDGKEGALWLRAVAGAVLQAGAQPEQRPGVGQGTVSESAPTESPLRRSARVIAMLAELHKAGFQRLRLGRIEAAAGSVWAAAILPASHLAADGVTPRDLRGDRAEGWLVEYHSAQGAHYFGWRDAEGKTARWLAARFIERFPTLARDGFGRDWGYAGWLAEVHGRVEHGVLPSLREDDPDGPPAPLMELDLAPGMDEGSPLPTAWLTREHVPDPSAPLGLLERFAFTYDGYQGGWRSLDQATEIAEAVLAGRLEEATLENLRAALFWCQRKHKWNDGMPNTGLEYQMRGLVAEIRHRLDGGHG